MNNVTIRHSIFGAALLMGLGLCAIAAPLASSGVVIVLAWVLMFGGVAHLFSVLQSDDIGNAVWKVLVAALNLVTGLVIYGHPFRELAGLTTVVGAMLLGEGILNLAAYVAVPEFAGSPWTLANAGITFVLGLVILKRWLPASLWPVGALVGVNLLAAGATRLMLALAARRRQKQFV